LVASAQRPWCHSITAGSTAAIAARAVAIVTDSTVSK
jgi:hypothetical protein